MSAVKDAKDMLFSDTSLELYLTRLGGNYGVPRPNADPSDDDLYRKFVQLLAAQPKTRGVRVVVQMLETLFGTQQSIIDNGHRPWQIYEIKPNVLTVEIPYDLFSASTANASYLHGLGGEDGYSDPVLTNVLYVSLEEDFTRAANDFTILTLNLFALGTFPITSVVYDPIAKLNTITFTGAIPVDLTNLKWSVLIPATDSFTGSYLLPNATHPETEVNEEPVILFGPGLVDVFTQYMLALVKAAGVVLDIQFVSAGYVRP